MVRGPLYNCSLLSDSCTCAAILVIGVFQWYVLFAHSVCPVFCAERAELARRVYLVRSRWLDGGQAVMLYVLLTLVYSPIVAWGFPL